MHFAHEKNGKNSTGRTNYLTYDPHSLFVPVTMKRLFTRAIRRYLNSRNLEIGLRRYDLDSFFITESLRQRVVADTAEVVRRYMNEEHIFPVFSQFEVKNTVERFFSIYPDNPAKTISGGCGFNSLLWLYTIVQSLDPELIAESGSYKGGSAWILQRAAPNAKIHSFDLDLSRLLVKAKSINFHEQDWTTYSFKDIDPHRSLIFFDDHCDQVSRLLEANEKGFKYLIFDDNTPLNFLCLARSGVATLDMLFDERLSEGDVIEWSMLGERCSYNPNFSQFEEARRMIRQYLKVPCLHSTNGFAHMTPLTLVVLK